MQARRFHTAFAPHSIKANPSTPGVFVQQYLSAQSPFKPLLSSPHAAVIPNLYPARLGHVLVIPRREIPLIKDLTPDERQQMMELVSQFQHLWLGLPQNQGKTIHFSVYINDGVIAGQTKPHAHIHVIPIDEHAPIAEATIRRAINLTQSADMHARIQVIKGNQPAIYQTFQPAATP